MSPESSHGCGGLPNRPACDCSVTLPWARSAKGTDMVLYAGPGETTRETSQPEETAEERNQASGVTKKRKVVMCARCRRIQTTVSDVQTHSAAEHLFLVTAPFCPGMVGVLRSSSPHKHVRELETELPGKLEMLTVWYGKGDRHDDVCHNLNAFRADCPGGWWFHMTPQPASAVISKLLFDNCDDDLEPGITILDVDDAA